MDGDNIIGSSWDKLFPKNHDLPIPTEKPPPKLDPDEIYLTEHAMIIFGRRPETDLFYTLVCDICGKVLMAAAMPRHLLRHGDGLAALKTKADQLKAPIIKKPIKETSPAPPNITPEEPQAEVSNVICSACSISIPSTAFRRHVLKIHSDDPTAKPLLAVPLKVKTVKKSSPSKKSKSISVSPPDLTEEAAKDARKMAKYKKCKSPIPPELEPMMPAAKRVGIVSGPPELSPIELPKKSSSKKKADRVYDPNKNCGVINEAGKPCLRSILCKAHLVAQKRAVLNRSMPYDVLSKLNKSQNEEEWRPKLEVELPIDLPPVELLTVNAPTGQVWSEPIFIEPLEPVMKRCRTAELEEDNYVDLPSDDEALIEATLKDLEKSEPLLKWSFEAPVCAPTPAPPMYFLPDLPWHSSHPKPLATNTFGCRLVGGLMTKCKKLDAFRKHVQTVWGGPNSGDSGSKFVGFSAKGSASLRKPDMNQKRKLKSSGSEIMAGLLQRTAPPTNGFTGINRSFFPTNPATFVQFNMCSSK